MQTFWDRNLKPIDGGRALADGTYFGLEATDEGFLTRVAYGHELILVEESHDYGEAVDKIMAYCALLAPED